MRADSTHGSRPTRSAATPCFVREVGVSPVPPLPVLRRRWRSVPPRRLLDPPPCRPPSCADAAAQHETERRRLIAEYRVSAGARPSRPVAVPRAGDPADEPNRFGKRGLALAPDSPQCLAPTAIYRHGQLRVDPGGLDMSGILALARPMAASAAVSFGRARRRSRPGVQGDRVEAL